MRVHHLPLPRLALYEAWHRLRRPSVERATGAIDVIHATANAMPPKTAPLVLTIHDLAFVHHPEHFTARGVRFFKRGLELAKSDADVVLCPSHATIADCEEAGFSAERLRLVPLGVEVEPATEDEVAEARRRYHLERPYLLWVGTIEPRKNLPGLLEAYARAAPDVDLVLVGPEGWNEDLASLTARFRVGVKALGFVPRDDLRRLYAGAAALTFPSLSEGFGFPVLEAMAQGTPVVTSVGTSTEELAAGAAILVDAHDPASVAKGIEKVLSDSGLAARLAERGRARAMQYSWQRTGDLIERVYRELSG